MNFALDADLRSRHRQATDTDAANLMKAFLIACLAVLSASAPAQVSPSPWFGKWKLRLNDPKEEPETLIYSDAGGGAMRMMSIEEGSVIITRMDGRPAPNIGKDGSDDPLLAVKAMSTTSYTWIFFRAGKPYVQGVNTLSADQKTFREVSWLITKPSKTVTLIYERL